MPAYNFKKEFVEKIQNGSKRQTIRHKRKRPTRPGDILYLYTGMRTKSCVKLKQVVCGAVSDFRINSAGDVYIQDELCSPKFLSHFAKCDGFESSEEMVSFFEDEYGLPFEGAEVILW